MKPREWWIGKGDPGEDRIFNVESDARRYSNIVIHVIEVLPDTVTIRREELNTIRELVAKCYTGAAMGRIDSLLASTETSPGGES